MPEKKSIPNLITILGHTAAGKTSFAAHLAARIGGEIISADSRQVYRGMDIGTGKDFDDYTVDGQQVPFHLIDIADPGYEYNVYEFSRDFRTLFHEITFHNKMPVLCGGTGLYLESVLRGYQLINVPVSDELRFEMQKKTNDELKEWLSSFRDLHNTTDTVNRKRLIRAIEIESYYRDHEDEVISYPELHPVIFGIRFDREERRERITKRLEERLKKGMTGEVESLLASGIPPEKLEFYGLEYKYLTCYVTGKISYDEMFSSLNSAIHRFAKRQMTWFRKMEREGFNIHWLEGSMPMEEKIKVSMDVLGIRG